MLLLNIFECHASIIPVDRTRNLLPGNGDLRSQQDWEMGFCELNQIRRRCHEKVSLGFSNTLTLKTCRCQLLAECTCSATAHMPGQQERARSGLFDRTHEKCAIFLCNEADTRGRFFFDCAIRKNDVKDRCRFAAKQMAQSKKLL